MVWKVLVQRVMQHVEPSSSPFPEFAYHPLVRKLLVPFQELYPEIEVELSLTDALSDILEEGLHAGFRLGRVIAQDMVAISLTDPLKSVTVANPSYLKKNTVLPMNRWSC